MTDIFNNIRASLLSHCKNFIEANSYSTFDVFDFDAHATQDSLPLDRDLIGIAEYSLENEDKTYRTTVLFVVSTTSKDSGNRLLNEVVGKLFGTLRPGTNLTAVKSDSGAHIGHLVTMSPVAVMAVAATEGRPFQGIAASFGSSFLVPP